MFDLTGKTALVTGASGGIGSAIVDALLARGATVAASGSNADKLSAFAAERDGRHGRCPATCPTRKPPTRSSRRRSRPSAAASTCWSTTPA